jgi:hypothetical protein
VGGLLVIDGVGWRSMYFVVMPRVNLIVIFLTYACYLYSINCPTVICLPNICYFILWRDTTSELWTSVQFPLHCYHLFTLLALFTFSHITTVFHSIRSFLCLQQTGEIDNLIVSWEQNIGCVVCRFCVVLIEDAPTSIVNGALVGAVAKLASITFTSLASSCLDRHTLVSY